MTPNTTGPPGDFGRNAALVVAHPDDEVLWFSSVLRQVERLVICFLGVASRPDWARGRRKSIDDYPLQSMQCLGLDEAEVFYGVDWSSPVETDYGLRISKPGMSDSTYRHNFDLLQEKLGDTLSGYRRVITHNPWGEYGHVEHVQVYRAIKSLQPRLGFELWFPNYCSKKSATLMTRVLPRLNNEFITLPIDLDLAQSIAHLYQGHDCWTWYDDYEWGEQETFIQDIDDTAATARIGATFPLQFVNVGDEPKKVAGPNYYRTIRRKLRSAAKGIGLVTD